jgi:hypothetical protein
MEGIGSEMKFAYGIFGKYRESVARLLFFAAAVIREGSAEVRWRGEGYGDEIDTGSQE